MTGHEMVSHDWLSVGHSQSKIFDQLTMIIIILTAVWPMVWLHFDHGIKLLLYLIHLYEGLVKALRCWEGQIGI